MICGPCGSPSISSSHRQCPQSFLSLGLELSSFDSHLDACPYAQHLDHPALAKDWHCFSTGCCPTGSVTLRMTCLCHGHVGKHPYALILIPFFYTPCSLVVPCPHQTLAVGVNPTHSPETASARTARKVLSGDSLPRNSWAMRRVQQIPLVALMGSAAQCCDAMAGRWDGAAEQGAQPRRVGTRGSHILPGTHVSMP